MMGTDCKKFEQMAPEDIQRDLNQCNRRCRQLPSLGRIGNEWIVACLCSSTKSEDMLKTLLMWNNFNQLKRLTSAAKLAALREVRRRDAEKESVH